MALALGCKVAAGRLGLARWPAEVCTSEKRNFQLQLHLQLSLATSNVKSRKKIRYTSRFVRVILVQGHVNLLCIVPILTDDPRRESRC